MLSLEELHRLGKHSIGRHGNLRVLLHGEAAFHEKHGGVQVIEGFAELVRLKGSAPESFEVKVDTRVGSLPSWRTTWLKYRISMAA